MSAEPLTYAETLKRNRELGEDSRLKALPRYEIPVLSNIVTSQLNSVLEFQLRSKGINAHLVSGEYDNIVQDAGRFASARSALILWELSNLVDGLQYKAEIMGETDIASLESKVQQEITFALKALQAVPVVVISRFSSLLFSHAALRAGAYERLGQKLNRFLETETAEFPNVILLDTDKIIARVSVAKSADMRFFYSSKALYTVDFFTELSAALVPIFLSMHGKTKKVLVFDCDNTLWKGILGEDGAENIRMSAKQPSGAPFEEVQCIAGNLQKRGVLLGLCSKNNDADVKAVLSGHPDMTLRPADFAVFKVNWADKTSNLRQIAKELNVGLDSIVFVDDSDFEINLVRETLPEVETIQVPRNVHQYPGELRRRLRSFFQLQASAEDLRRGEMYEEETLRVGERAAFESLEDYLASLQLQITISQNDPSQISRIAQMAQKTNQFNLTTHRYAEADIRRFLQNGSHRVFSFSAADKFGDYGLVGAGIVVSSGTTAEIDSLLISCRALGRNLEWAFLDRVMKRLSTSGVRKVRGTYLSTPRNTQVADFFDRAGFAVESTTAEKKTYVIEAESYRSHNLPYIGVIDGR